MFVRKPVDLIQSRFKSPPKHWRYTKILISSRILSLRVDKKTFEESILRSLSQAREATYTSTKSTCIETTCNYLWNDCFQDNKICQEEKHCLLQIYFRIQS